MKKIALSIYFIFCFAIDSFAQKEVRLSGIVRDFSTGQPLENVSVYVGFLKKGVITDSLGKFFLKLPEGRYNFLISSLGYRQKSLSLAVSKNQFIDIELVAAPKELDEVMVKGEKEDRNVVRTQMSVEKLSIKTIKEMPKLMGEADIIRGMLMLPGVSTVGEGAAGFNVRGGNTDQNLVLFDDTPIFSTSHLFGFFTTFNPDVVKDVSLYKGGIPAVYGGRVSSVLDVGMREGNFERLEVSGGLSQLTGKIMVSAPIIKDKLAFLVAGRSSFSDYYLKKFPDPNIRNSKANFYDANARLSFRPSKRQAISLSSYISQDYFRFGLDTSFSNETKTLTLRHNYFQSSKFSTSFSAYLANYQYGSESQNTQLGFRWFPKMEYAGLKEIITLTPNKRHKIDLGAEYFNLKQRNGNLEPSNKTSIINSFKTKNENAETISAFISHDFTINQLIGITTGLRATKFKLIGESVQYKYLENTPRSQYNIIDSTIYQKGERYAKRNAFEPRLALNYIINKKASIKLNYNRLVQFIHLISNSFAISPVDLWKNSNDLVPPQIADQFAAGYFRNFKENAIETSVEFYYKNYPQLVDYKDGAKLFLNKTVETELVQGKGQSYGTELMIKKNRGGLTGWVSYSYARSFRQIDNRENQNPVNFGLRYPANFDIPHSLKILMSKQLGRYMQFNTNLIYTTGRPITYPTGRYKVYNFSEWYDKQKTDGQIPANNEKWNELYGEADPSTAPKYYYNDGYGSGTFTLRNAERIPDYIRLDVSLNIMGRESKKLKSEINVAIYNLLGRRNPYSVYFQSSTGTRNIAATYKLSVLGAAIPSINYNFRF